MRAPTLAAALLLGILVAYAMLQPQAVDRVRLVEITELDATKQRFGVLEELSFCHTAEVTGYIVEGHVPVGAIRRLLAEKPEAIGLAVPGMPIGSPGMEVGGGKPDTYEVVVFGPRGRRTFALYQGDREL